jgi:hypothetical protein
MKLVEATSPIPNWEKHGSFFILSHHGSSTKLGLIEYNAILMVVNYVRASDLALDIPCQYESS